MILPPSPASKETLIWRLWPLQELPKCTWHSVEHLECTTTFGKLSGLHCGLKPLTFPPCPQSALLPLPSSCAVPAPPSRSRPCWHSVEHLPCVLWARPERTFCTRAHYADTPHCRTRRDPTLAPSASLSRALAAPLLHDPSGVLLHRWPRPWRHAGVGSGFRRGRRRPNHQRTPAAPVNSSCLSPRSSARFHRRCDALQLQQRLSPTSLSSAAAEPPRHAI